MESLFKSKLMILRRQFFQLVEPAQLQWLDGSILKQPETQSWIYDHLFNADEIAHLPPQRYQLRVLKLLIPKLEDSIEDLEEDVRFPSPRHGFAQAHQQPEISDDLMSSLSSLLVANLPSESTSAQQKAYVTYAFPLHLSDEAIPQERAVTLLESRSMISSLGTTGLRTWEAALHLGAFLASERGSAIVRGKKVLELGAGTGMLSIFCAKYLNISGIVATDGNEAVVDAIKTNSFLNGLDTDDLSRTTVRTAALKWGWPIIAATFSEDYGMGLPDVVLGADVTYDNIVIPALASSLREFFELNPAVQVLIAATIRSKQTFETFLSACRRNRFNLDLLDFPPRPEHLQDGPFYPTSTPIQIWSITRSQEPSDVFAF
ncbi:hypothetical protein K458DRAFT_464154 [Lentithecium fluviatile CBS 122367]|uniref:Methyltransferase-domain-containing protein n=1 Tax=Lentithecium fluviatile CBS 122367 TaxID=1168545 RepID=A0A6G1IJQ7_9PLEO|nr:hypothetical protein K458DRAFT_464154 [Lentithecium fluviatile CBS 122367]